MARSQGISSSSSQMRRFGYSVELDFVTAATVSQPRGVSPSHDFQNSLLFVGLLVTSWTKRPLPSQRRCFMKTGIRKGIDVIRLATGLYKEMAVSALTLIPSIRLRFTG